MAIEPRAARCCCCNARITLIVLLFFYIFVGAIGAIYWIAGTSDHAYQKYHTYLLCYRVWGFVGLALYIPLLYGAVKRQSRILMAGFIYETITAVLIGVLCLLVIIMPSVQSMICYLYLIVYREAKRFQDNR
ncbi:hypothetical protein WR25_09764 [Diploscapter pachys]|uniref:Uncharacterized protein n=1 Tax=Diploscapter pachys TaxID=2018661 RepID=A0A2A2K3A8_9BILA|nr:hypothetical protein WR25_09764 [Diploscapter pachys]